MTSSLQSGTDSAAQTVSAGEEDLDPNEMVRVSIVLDGASTLEAGYDAKNIAKNPAAVRYRDGLEKDQHTVQAAIEREVLDGELEPNMAIAGEMNGTRIAWESGYTGAGTKIAIIDTGLDIEHQSFAEKAFLHAVGELDDVDLMDASDIEAVLKELNVYERSPDVTAEALYKNAKVPFGYNYIDVPPSYIEHDEDAQGEHGSRVAGIAAANRYIDTGKDGKYENALESVLTAGNAPDAQLLIMKMFGKNGGAYDADYMAAIEDAIVLGADSVNLSLGSSTAGFASAGIYQDIKNSLADSNTVATMSSGNDSCWAGLTPGNNESAGKKKSVRISRAGVYLKPALVQVAHAAVKDKFSPYYALKYEGKT